MSDRAVTAATWLAFVATALVLGLVVSCGSDTVSTSDAPTAASSSDDDTADAALGGDDAEAADPGAPEAAAELVPMGQPPAGNPELLDEWAQLDVADGRLVLADGVVPYTLNSPLFSDYAHKLRTVSLPDGTEPAGYDPDGVLDFPVGTVITKTFYYPVADDVGDGDGQGDDATGELRVLQAPVDDAGLVGSLDLATVRLIETRVLVHRADGWQALPYVWNDEQTEATLERTGALVRLTLVDDTTHTPFVYVVPDVNQCAACHATNHTTGAIEPIGPKARHLNTEVDYGVGEVSQLAHWESAGLLAGAPMASAVPATTAWDDDSAPIDERARAYLDINCSHCHNSAGAADTSGLFLEPTTEVGFSLGVCKPPIAAGNGTGGRIVGIQPGEPDESIFVYRLSSDDPGQMMPEVGRSLVHAEGVDLISLWIESISGTC